MSLPSKKVAEIIDKHSELEKELASSNIDSKSFAQKSKEYSSLNEIIENALEYYNYEKNKNEIEKIIKESTSDDELSQLAKERN